MKLMATLVQTKPDQQMRRERERKCCITLYNVLKNKGKQVSNIPVNNRNLVHTLKHTKQEKNELLSQKIKVVKHLENLKRK